MKIILPYFLLLSASIHFEHDEEYFPTFIENLLQYASDYITGFPS